MGTDRLVLPLVIVRLFVYFSTIYILADILAVGSYNPPNEQHKKAEVLNTEKDTWSRIGDYPYDKGFKLSFLIYALLTAYSNY